MAKILVCGPCVGEFSEQWIVDQAGAIRDQLSDLKNLDAEWVFKCSFDKANRTSGLSYRGLGLDATLRALAQVRDLFGCRVTTDIHEVWQAHEMQDVVDVIQIPAMLMRQTDLIRAAARNAMTVNIKISPTADELDHVLDKAAGAGWVWLTYRGTAYGERLVFEPGRLLEMALDRESGGRALAILDITHTARDAYRDPEQPWADLTWAAARCGAALGVDGLFLECHPDPAAAMSDSHTQVEIGRMGELLGDLPW